MEKLMLNYINFDKVEDYICDIKQIIEDLESDLEELEEWVEHNSIQMNIAPNYYAMNVPQLDSIENYFGEDLEDYMAIDKDWFEFEIVHKGFKLFYPNEDNSLGEFQLIVKIVNDPNGDSYEDSYDYPYMVWEGNIHQEKFDKYCNEHKWENLLGCVSKSKAYKSYLDIVKLG